MAVTGTPKLLREINIHLIINTIREVGRVSRADLARKLGLSQPTVSLIIEHLVKQGILLEVGIGSSSGGRRPILLTINPDYRYIVGVDLSQQNVDIAIGNLSCEIIASSSLVFSQGDEASLVLSGVAETIKKLFQANQIDLELLGTIVFAVPGVFDPKTGMVTRAAHSFNWNGLVIKDMLRDHFASSILIQNDVNIGVLGEFSTRRDPGIQSLAYISVGVGIGAGIILNGQLWEGCHGTAGEIGFMALSRDVLDTTYRHYRNLETISSTTSIVKRAREIIASKKTGILSDLSWGDPKRVDFDLICQAASLHDEDAQGLLKEMAISVGLAVANLQNVLDLEIIVLGGAIISAGEVFLEEIQNVVNMTACNQTEITFSCLREKTVLVGAIAVAADSIYDSL